MKSQGLKKLKLPDAPGVYFWKDGKGKTLYIGRATSLRSRVHSYFGNDVISTRGSRIVDMVTRSKTVMFEKTDSVLEAIILEANLIKKFQPKYNIDEKDDKSWNYIVITDEEWPRVIVERGRNLKKEVSISRPNNDIFGPYPAGGLLKDALKIIRRIFPYLDEKSIDPKHRSFYASIGLSPMLGGKTSRKEYLKTIKNIRLFLEGKKKTIIKNLKKDMMVYAKNQEFEKADKAKHTIYALEHIEDVALIKDDKTNGIGSHGGFRIEAYDIAHLSGKNVVGVMTVVEGGEPNKNEYRKFKISKEKNDDAAALREILLRRLGHSEWPYPSLIVVDGGQAQLNVAQKVLSELKSDIMVVALVKDDKHKARGILADESLIAKNPVLLSQYKRAIILANNEAHRFAIAYHKNLRKRNFLK
jgi:excinuclease ABC subunit C